MWRTIFRKRRNTGDKAKFRPRQNNESEAIKLALEEIRQNAILKQNCVCCGEKIIDNDLKKFEIYGNFCYKCSGLANKFAEKKAQIFYRKRYCHKHGIYNDHNLNFLYGQLRKLKAEAPQYYSGKI